MDTPITQSTVQDAPATQVAAAPVAPLDQDIVTYFMDRAEASRKVRKKNWPKWKRSVDLRLGNASVGIDTDSTNEADIKSEINPDWSLTKTKTANLFSQVPKVNASYENKQYKPAVAPFLRTLNYEISAKRCNIAAAMEETLNDVVNAAGIGGILTGYMARTETKQVPQQDTVMLQGQAVPTKMFNPDQQQRLVQAGLIQMVPVEQRTDFRFYQTRISPADLLTPAEFTGSDFNDGDFVGYDGKMPSAMAKVQFKMSDEDLKQLQGEYDEVDNKSLQSEPEGHDVIGTKNIRYTEIFYWRYRVDPDEKCFDCIWRLVFVKGKAKAVVHEPWDGQKLVEGTHKYIGSCLFPLQILTVTYVTDNPIPPSDSEAGRSQVNDMRRSRSQMFSNREFSRPLRGFDVNRIDPLIQTNLMRGAWQGMIPINGRGQDAIWEVARASYPSENLAFDQQAKTDLQESWQIGPQQMGLGGSGAGSATGDSLAQQNFATRIGQERNKVSAFFLNCCSVLAGLIVLYSDFSNLTDQEKQAMTQAWNGQQISQDVVFTLLPDSTVVLDSNQRVQKLANFLNLTVKSGIVNPAPIITEMAELSGIDPAEVIVQPPPPQPEDPNISFRFTGKHDLMNPVVMAAFMKKYPVSPEELNNAKKLLMANQDSMPVPDDMLGNGAGPAGAPGEQPPSPGAPAGEDQKPDWQLGNKIAKRSEDMSA